MASRADFLYSRFLERLSVAPTSDQDAMLRTAANFLCTDEGDILVVNGYAGTGKTTAIAAVVAALREFEVRVELLAPTGRSAKLLSEACRLPAHTIHKHIYKQKSFGDDGFGRFGLVPNRAKDTLFVVDEVSLIGIEEGTGSSAAFGSGNLLEDLITFVRSGIGCRLMLIGDDAQLPPVGLSESPALSPQYIDAFGGVAHASLSEVVRQAKESGILRNATLLRKIIASSSPEGVFDAPKLQTEGFGDISRISGAELLEKLSDSYGRYSQDGVVVLCRSNKMAIRYNNGIRSMIQYKEDRLVKGDRLMIVKNCYQFGGDAEGLEYIANGDIAELVKASRFEQRYGLDFAQALLRFPDYGGAELTAKICLNTLESESAALSYEQQNALYQGVSQDYSSVKGKRDRYKAVREDPYYNALQIKYADALTVHKSQGGQWDCVFIDCPFYRDEMTLDELKWLYTALTRAVKQIYLVNFPDRFFV